MNENVTVLFQQMHNHQKANIARSFGYAQQEKIEKAERAFSEEEMRYMNLLSSEDAEVRKAAEEELEKSELSTFQKSDIYEAVNYSEEFRVKKTGKEIKEQIKNIILPKKQAELATQKAEADKLLEECGDAPTKQVDNWWTCGMEFEVGYKSYTWEEICSNCCEDTSISNSLSFQQQEKLPKRNCAKSKDEEVARRAYNDVVHNICRIMVDIKTCEILSKNLSDNQDIKLSTRQVIAFEFD